VCVCVCVVCVCGQESHAVSLALKQGNTPGTKSVNKVSTFVTNWERLNKQ